MLRGYPNEHNLISFHFAFRAENASRKIFSADDTRRLKPDARYEGTCFYAFHRIYALILLPF
jgi:hypothetical protein